MTKNPAFDNPAAASPSHPGVPPAAPPAQRVPAPAMPVAPAMPMAPAMPTAGTVPKYIKVNGVMTKNPAHPDNRAGAGAARALQH
jgi:hypothetical protein